MKITDNINFEKVEITAKKFRILCHLDRVDIVQMLLEQEGMNVTQIQDRIGLRQADTSNHLKLLKKYGYLNSKQQGKFVIYSVNTEFLEKIIKISEKFFLNR